MGVATGRDLARFLRRHHQGVLAFGGRVAPARYVVEGRSEGAPALIVGLEPVALSAPEHLLFVPEERADAAQVLLVPIRAPSTGDRGTDRWEGYFGPPSKLALCRAVVRGVKWRGEVYEGETLDLSNPLLPVQGRLLRELNADPRGLIGLCARAGGTAARPVAVGMDPDGLDIRAEVVGVVRVEFPEPAPNEAEAEARVRALRTGAGGSAA